MDKRVNDLGKGVVRAKPAMVRRGSLVDERLVTVMESAPDMVAMVDLDGRLLFVSAASQLLLGLHAERLHGHSLYEFIHGSDNERVRRFQQQLLASDDAAECEFRMRHVSGNILWVAMRCQPVKRGHDQMVAVVRDISARHHVMVQEKERLGFLEHQLEDGALQQKMAAEQLKRYEEDQQRDKEALEQLERRYTALVENTLTGIFVHDGRKLVFCNERFAQIFGFDRDCIDDVDTDRLFSDGRTIEAMLTAKEHDDLVEGETCQGGRVWLKVSRARTECQGREMVIGNVIDVTEQTMMNEQLLASKMELHTLSAQLMAAQESERKRIANELHDGLGQRLSAIKFAVENVWRTTDREMFSAQSTRLGAIIEAIRDSIEEVRRVSMDLRPTILDDLGLLATIGWFCREFGLVFPEIGVHRNITVREAEIPDEVKVVIFRIIQEAFHNISRHAQADLVELELSLCDGILQLQIRDNGHGIATIDRSPCAKGLGLKSMRERAELSRGEFKIDSAPGLGTTVSVQWPHLAES